MSAGAMQKRANVPIGLAHFDDVVARVVDEKDSERIYSDHVRFVQEILSIDAVRVAGSTADTSHGRHICLGHIYHPDAVIHAVSDINDSCFPLFFVLL
jgi:hypothetical protein